MTDWRDLRTRVASAAVMVPVALGCVWLGGVWFEGLVAAGVAAMGWEWHRMSGGSPRMMAIGLLYIGPGALALLWLRGGAVGLANVAFVFGVVWASDIGAYMVGRLVGGQKLAPSISPGKTWSGAFGGLVAVAVVGLVVGGIWAVLVACVVGVAAQLGDLLESGVKRHFGVKDSGWLIPGHGGVLDRVDALLTAAPVAALIGWYFAPAGLLWGGL
jgi:phosphatidate cytidylyltransferase